MSQVTWRASEDLVARVKQAARSSGRSLNEFVTFVLSTAIDPDLAGSERERLRERLAAAGFLVELEPVRRRRRPPPEALDAARMRAGRGTKLSDLVTDDRG